MHGLSKAIYGAPLCLASLFAAAFAQVPVSKVVGTVKTVAGGSVIVTTDRGETTVTVAESTRIVRATPGQTDLRNATPIQVSDIQPGDRVFARGQAGQDNSLIAASLLVMKQSDIAERQQREREEWRRGVGGIVKAVNPAENTVTLNNALAAQGKATVVHITSQTQLLRYPPNSFNFEDAKPGAIDQIKPGDQLNARGTKNADGSEFTAQAIVSGTFLNIAGTVISADAANSTVTINDLATKKPVVVKIGSDSQLRKLPTFVAMMIAMRLKGGTPGAASAGAGQQGDRYTGSVE